MKSPINDQNCVAMLVRRALLRGFLIIGLSIMISALYINVFQHPPPNAILANNFGGGGGFDVSKYGPPRSNLMDNTEDGEVFEDRQAIKHPKFNKNLKSNFDNDDDDWGDNNDNDGDDNDVIDIEDDSEDEEVEEVEVTQKLISRRKPQRQIKSKSNSNSHKDKGSNIKKTRFQNKNSPKKSPNRSDHSNSKSSVVKHADYWQRFVERNRFVPIGVVYDKCENWNSQFGVVVMLPDKEFGGVKTRTFVNITLPHEISGGQFSIEVKYNGKELYDNYWEICEMEEDVPPVNRTFNCPLAGGLHSRVKDRHIPNYLPKGRYETKAWAKDEKEVVFACGYSDFKI